MFAFSVEGIMGNLLYTHTKLPFVEICTDFDFLQINLGGVRHSTQ